MRWSRNHGLEHSKEFQPPELAGVYQFRVPVANSEAYPVAFS